MFFVKNSRSGLTFILVSSLLGIAAVLLFREKGNFREFVSLLDEVMLEEVFVIADVLLFGEKGNFREFVSLLDELMPKKVFVVAAVLPVVNEDNSRAFFGLTEDISEPAVGSNCYGAGCGCADRWDCPFWCWLRWL